MKIKHKKVAASGIAVALAGVLGVGALLQTSVSVQASSAMMPGIEEIVSEASADKPFKILEIVDNTQDAEIGYYVSGQEPYIKLYSYTYTYKDKNNEEKQKTIHFQTLEEGLEKLPSDTLRQQFAENVKIDKTGEISGDGTDIKNIQNICYQSDSTGNSEDYPLSYSPYKEQYFISSDEEESGNWTRIDFKDVHTGENRTDTVKINGEYQENPAGTGDYTKQEQTYYPIREGSDDSSRTDKYRENIRNFYYADSGEENAPYFLEFEDVDNTTVNAAFDANGNKINDNILAAYNYENGEYGYYENVYSDLTNEIVGNIQKDNYTFPGENPEINLESAVKIPNITNTTSANARTFSDGTDDFSSVNEVNSADTESANVDQANISADNSQTADAFSSGDFSDGVSADGDIGDSGNAQTQDSADTGTDSAFDAGTDQTAGADSAQADPEQTASEIVNDEINPLIPYTQTTTQASTGEVTSVDESVGKSSNPKVYYGRTIDQYPYYQYTLISDMEKIVACAAVNQEAVNNGTYQPIQATTPEAREHNITFQDDQYWYWTANADGTFERNPISVVTQRQPVSYDDIRKLPENLGYNYYYRVKQAYFCCSQVTGSDNDHAYIYYGWYSPSYADQNNVYIKVSDGDGKVATHYISEAEYKLTPGIGNYDFVPDDTKGEATVEVNHMYYQGGYKNNDWFKKYVFHLDPNDEETAKKFKIQVDTISADDFNTEYRNSATNTNETEAADSSQAADSAQSDSTDSAEDSSQTDQNSEAEQIENTDQMNDASDISAEEQQQTEAGGNVSEVQSMVSEAGVELVSIENEISDGTLADTTVDEFQDGTVAETENPIMDDTFDDDSAFSAGDASTVDMTDKLSEYDLVYINGEMLNTASLEVLADMASEKQLPCIINEMKIEGNVDFSDTFSGFINNEDTDKHYVNNNVYFFRNTFSEDGLVTGYFNMDFNSETNSDADPSSIKGFEEILDYIENENQYRALGKGDNTETGTDVDDSIGDGEGSEDISDGDDTNTLTDGSENAISPLGKEISQARVIEYIINYKYKRVNQEKTNINVLEIMPAKGDSQIDEDTVMKWVQGEKRETLSVCCYESGQGADKLEDDDNNTMWDHAWRNWGTNYNHDGLHFIQAVFAKPEKIKGFSYTPRPNYSTSNGNSNGVLKKYKVVLTYSNGQTDEIENELNITSSEKVDITFEKEYSDIKEMKVYFVTAQGDKQNLASCAEFKVLYVRASESKKHNVNVNITHMTASEFAGYIGDIGSEYDMIYISDKKKTGDDSLITGDGELRYAHVGAAVKANATSAISSDKGEPLLKLLGQLDKDYTTPDKDGTLRLAPYSTYSEDGSGYFRGSGNDITHQQYTALMEFVKSGYPVVFAPGLLSGNSVNTSEVDSSSWYYKFICDSKDYDNVTVAKKDSTDKLTTTEKDLDFFYNLAKPQIDFSQGEKPKEPQRKNEDIDENYGYIDGELKYTFTVRNDSEAAPASASYNCNLYLDLNFDGNFSDNEDQSKYIVIQDESGNNLSMNKKSQYELKVGKTYTVTRKIPSDYYKLITWKLKLTSNQNDSIHTSVTGYAKQSMQASGEENINDKKQVINVLQLLPDSTYKDNWGNIQNKENKCTWDLSKSQRFWYWMNQVDDFQLNLTTAKVSDINDGKYWAYDLNNSKITYKDMADMLSDQQMLIIGFADVYQDISLGNVEEIEKFINAGRSVIFSHDTTSYVNYDYTKVFKKIAQNDYSDLTNASQLYNDGYLRKASVNNVTWGYSLNTILRTIVGMDRYGITSKESIGNTTVGTLLKRGNELTDGTVVNFSDLIKHTGDIAYKNNDNSQSYAQTQGYTNNILNNKEGKKTTTATRVNDGAITQYPYRIGTDINDTDRGESINQITIGETHSQYYQLGMEQDSDGDGSNDIVVWYCLANGEDNVYKNSPNDVRNNYYFYSKGNVIYTGAGHSDIDKSNSDNTEISNDTEIQLFVNAIVAAANVVAVKPEVEFVKSLDSGAQRESVRYYMTDQTSWNTDAASDGNVLEKNAELYFKVKDYNMVSSDLTVSAPAQMTVDLYIEDDKNGSILSDSPEEMKTVKVSSLNGKVKKLIPCGKENDPKGLNPDGSFDIDENNTYGFTISDIEQYLKSSNGSERYKANCKVYVRVTSTVKLYGKNTTSTSWASIDLKQRQLFDLD